MRAELETARSLQQRGRLGEALAAWEGLIGRDPDAVPVLAGCASALRRATKCHWLSTAP